MMMMMMMMMIQKMEQNFLVTTLGKESGNQPSLVWNNNYEEELQLNSENPPAWVRMME